MQCTRFLGLQKDSRACKSSSSMGSKRRAVTKLYRTTWMNDDESECWLETWLVDGFPQAHILSVSYDSSRIVSDTEGIMGMYILGENLAQCIVQIAGSGGHNCPVVLVGHCIGDLVLKAVCLKIHAFGYLQPGQGRNRYVNFLDKLKGSILLLDTALRIAPI
ncbi:hypothetical protein Mapa_017761 [Marchantia paleacea]|nr:hypothetical protein Mapa_017761 [Marchantia paleacea]